MVNGLNGHVLNYVLNLIVINVIKKTILELYHHGFNHVDMTDVMLDSIVIILMKLTKHSVTNVPIIVLNVMVLITVVLVRMDIS